jgi:threonine dehydrogenase-like Zn-dependent dehydrogenase
MADGLALVLEKPRSAAVVRRPDPTAGEGDALVRLRMAGVCGSDLAAYRGLSPLVSYPRVLGHELLVDVESCPSRPDLDGRRAVVEPLLSCGRCKPCRLGRPNCCVELAVLGVHADGGIRERFAVPARLLHEVPEALPDEVAVLAEPTTIAYRAVERSAVRAGSRAVVLGAGPIGLLIGQLLSRSRGCRVAVVDVDAERLAIAERLGLTAVAAAGDVAGQVGSWSNGELADAVFEATGSAAAARLTPALVGFTGSVVMIGWQHAPLELDTVTLMRKEATLLGSRNSVAAFPPVLRLLADGAVDADAMLTHRVPLERAEESLAILDGGERSLKVVIDARSG